MERRHTHAERKSCTLPVMMLDEHDKPLLQDIQDTSSAQL